MKKDEAVGKCTRDWFSMRTLTHAAIIWVLAMAPVQAQTAPNTDASSSPRAVEMTFLLSAPGQRENLKRFIVLNWFAMDHIAKEQGLMQAFTVMDTGSDEGPWNLLVSVTYMDERGYAGIAPAFEKIRSMHRTVPVEGKTLRELGKIVESRKLLEDPRHGTR